MSTFDQYKPKAAPVKDDTLISDFHPSRFLTVEDFTERWHITEKTFTIARVAWEETTPNNRDIDPTTNKPRIVMQAVLYFKTSRGEYPRGYLIKNKVDNESLKTATGAKRAGELIGKRILIEINIHRKKEVLRISPLPPLSDPTPPQTARPTAGNDGKSEPPAPSATTDETDEERSQYTQEYDETSDADSGL